MPEFNDLKPYQKEAILLKLKWIYDPVPPWLKLRPEIVEQFAKLDAKFNERIVQIEMEKMVELDKIMGKYM